MSEEKLFPKLRFNGFDDEWQSHKLGEISDVTKLAGFEFTEYVNYSDKGNIIALRGLNVKNNKLDLTDVKYIDNSDFTKLNRSKLYLGDLLFTYVGTIGEVALISEDDKYYLAPNVCRIRCNNEVNPDLLKFYFNTIIIKKEILKYVTKSSQPALSMENIRKFKIKLPNIVEQEKIANFLISVDNKIELIEKKYEAYVNFKKYLMQQIFAQKLRFDYEIVKLKNISKINKGKQLNKDAMIEDGEYYVLNGGQEPSGYTNEWNTPENTITISEGGNSCGFVNFNEEKFWSGGHCYFLSDLDNQTDTYYLYSYLKFKEEHIMRLRVGSGLPNIQKSDIENFKVQLVSKEEQNKISNLLLSADKKVDFIKNQKENFENFKHGLLQQMFV